MKLRELLPFCDGIIKITVYTCDGKKHQHKSTGARAQFKFAKYLDFDIYSVKSNGGNLLIDYLDITIKEYHV